MLISAKLWTLWPIPFDILVGCHFIVLHFYVFRHFSKPRELYSKFFTETLVTCCIYVDAFLFFTTYLLYFTIGYAKTSTIGLIFDTYLLYLNTWLFLCNVNGSFSMLKIVAKNNYCWNVNRLDKLAFSTNNMQILRRFSNFDRVIAV